MNESVTKWLDELTAAPSTAIQKLVLGYAGVSAWSRSSLRESFVEVFQTHAEALDAAVAGWLRDRLMKLPPENTPTLVWASYLQDLFSALAGLPLTQVARLLRDRMRDFRSWLRPLRTDESLDPEVAYLAALAWAETNRHLEGMWHGIAMRSDHEPPYYRDVGLLGLRKTRDEQGHLPSKAPFLLLVTMIDLADTHISKKEWLLTVQAMLGGYHFSEETWTREFVSVLETRPTADRGPKWLKEVLPDCSAQARPGNEPRCQLIPTANLAEANAVIQNVTSHGPSPAVEVLVERYRQYALSTGDAFPLVRMFNRLAEAARSQAPEWAVARAEEALAWDEDNARNWTVLARCLWSHGIRERRRGNFNDADATLYEGIEALWHARFRFPANAHVRTELARMLRASGDTATAETIYREAEVEFPCNPWCFTGLADMLVRKSAETGDQSALLDEAHRLLQRASDLGNQYARQRLCAIARLRSAVPNAPVVEEPEQGEMIELATLHSQSVAEMRPAQRLGRALLLQWQARHADSATERERLSVEAATLLDLPDELTGECSTAFVDARGFLLLARDRVSDARAYFEQELATAAPRRPLGLRLGFAEARTRLGETLSENDETELASFGPEGSILPLVLRVVRLLESTDSDDALRDMLIGLYPRVRELAGMPPCEIGEEDDKPAEPTARARQPETPDSMLAQFLVANVFGPAAINTPDDFHVADSIPRVRAAFRGQRTDIFSMAEKLVLVA